MRKAFTLIELLIVVAIIAILAAIAVPNFLEAQVRSKVARAKADMRTLATGLEAYTVDCNKPPTMQIQYVNNGTRTINGASLVNSSFAGTGWGSPRFIRLTTPISYLSSVLVDPFAVNGYTTTYDTGGISPNYDTYDYVSAFDFAPGGLFPEGATNDWRGASVTSGGGWRLASAGPDRTQTFGGGYVGQPANPFGVDYDPTNGTVSKGDLVRIGGGPGPLCQTGSAKVPAIDRIQNKYNDPAVH